MTLCFCDGELVSYATATLIASYKYDLNYLRRGVYGTAIAAHGSGAALGKPCIIAISNSRRRLKRIVAAIFVECVTLLDNVGLIGHPRLYLRC